GLDGLAVGTLGESDLPEVDFGAAALELKHGVTDLRAPPTSTARPLRDLGAPHEEAAQLVLRDFEIHLLILAMHREHTGLGGEVLGDDIIVLLQVAGFSWR